MREQGGLERSLTGTPQGGILSPLLANIALSALDEHFAGRGRQMGEQRYRARKRGEATYRLIRYADDFVICVAGDRRHAEALVARPRGCSRPLGLTLSEEKTHIAHIDEGIDFLGWRIKRDLGRRGRRVSSTTHPAGAYGRPGEGQGDHPQRHQPDARPAASPAQPGAPRLVRLLPSRAIVANLPVPRPLRLAAGVHWLRRKYPNETGAGSGSTTYPGGGRPGKTALQTGTVTTRYRYRAARSKRRGKPTGSRPRRSSPLERLEHLIAP